MKKLSCVLWSYRMITHTTIKETLFRLTFGQDIVIPIEIGQTLERITNYLEKTNNQLKTKNLDFLKGDRKMAHIRSIAYKEKIKRYLDK